MGMKSIFKVVNFEFPYNRFKFPGQAKDEKILYVTRESKALLYLRLMMVVLVSLTLFMAGFILPDLLEMFGGVVVNWVRLGVFGLSVVFLVVGGWWIYSLWRKSIFILTNRRLTKFIYTTPWNRYNLSLSLDRVVDTGSYARGYFQALLGVGTFTARSSAGNRQEKYFYIENVHQFEDLANYVNKVLFVYTRDVDKLDSFRPFLPWLKGEARNRYMQDYPEFWS